MFCSECGTKNKKDSKFCENCGAKLIEEKVDKKDSIKASNKKLIIIGVVIVVILGFYIYGTNITKPEKIVESYIKALKSNDYNKLYNIIIDDSVKDKTFISKKVFNDTMEESNTLNKYKNIESYKVGNAIITNNGLTATVTVSYILKDNVEAKKETFTLTKIGKKELLFFDTWQQANKSLAYVENYTIKVPKDSKVEYAGVKVANKYLKKKTSTYDEYELPAVFKIKTNVKVTTKDKVEYEKDIYPTTYSKTQTISMQGVEVPSKIKKEIKATYKNILSTFLTKTSENTNFDDVNYEYFSKNLKTSYNTYKNGINAEYKKLSNFSVEKMGSDKMTYKEDGTIEVTTQVDFKYDLTYPKLNQTMIDKTSSRYIRMEFVKDGNKYILSKIDGLPLY